MKEHTSEEGAREGHTCNHMCSMCRMKESFGNDTCCKCGGYHHYFFLRLFIGILIVVFVFWLGVKFGFAACEMGNFDGYGYDSGYDNGPAGYDDGYDSGYHQGGRHMMGVYQDSSASYDTSVSKQAPPLVPTQNTMKK